MDTAHQRQLIQKLSCELVKKKSDEIGQLISHTNEEVVRGIKRKATEEPYMFKLCIFSKLCSLELQRRNRHRQLNAPEEKEIAAPRQKDRDDDDGDNEEAAARPVSKKRKLQKDLVERFIAQHTQANLATELKGDDGDALQVVLPPQRIRGARKKKQNVQAEAAPYCPIHASNYVCTFSLGCTIDIALVQRLFPGQINGEGLRSLHIAIRDPRLTVQIFGTGTVVIAGARTAEIALFGAHLLTHNLSLKLKRYLHVYGFLVRNIVAFGALGFRVDRLKLFREKGAVVADDAEAPPVSSLSLEERKKKKADHSSLVFVDGGMDDNQSEYYYGLALQEDAYDSDNEQDAAATTTAGLPKKAVNAGTRRRAKWRGREWCEWHPEQFGGVDYYPCYPLAIIVFGVGTFVVTGTNDPKKIVEAMNAIPDWTRYKLA